MESVTLTKPGSQNYSPWCFNKVNLVRFDGSNALQWIFQVEQFFGYYDISYSYRYKVVAIHFDDPVILWFQMLLILGVVSSWNALATTIETTYGPFVFDCPHYSLFKLFQDFHYISK